MVTGQKKSVKRPKNEEVIALGVSYSDIDKPYFESWKNLLRKYHE